MRLRRSCWRSSRSPRRRKSYRCSCSRPLNLQPLAAHRSIAAVMPRLVMWLPKTSSLVSMRNHARSSKASSILSLAWPRIFSNYPASPNSSDLTPNLNHTSRSTRFRRTIRHPPQLTTRLKRSRVSQQWSTTSFNSCRVAPRSATRWPKSSSAWSQRSSAYNSCKPVPTPAHHLISDIAKNEIR